MPTALLVDLLALLDLDPDHPDDAADIAVATALAECRVAVGTQRLRAIGHPSISGVKIRAVDNEPPPRLVLGPRRSV